MDIIIRHVTGNFMAGFLGHPADHNKTTNDYTTFVDIVEFALLGTCVILEMCIQKLTGTYQMVKGKISNY